MKDENVMVATTRNNRIYSSDTRIVCSRFLCCDRKKQSCVLYYCLGNDYVLSFSFVGSVLVERIFVVPALNDLLELEDKEVGVKR